MNLLRASDHDWRRRFANPLLRDPKVRLLAAVIFAGSMWFYVQHVLIPHQKADAAAHGIPRGNLSDLYPRWLGARELLLHHRDPYSPEITREIQAGYYGRPLDHARPFDPTDEQGFAYPVYVVFLLAPTIALPFALVQVGFRWLLIMLTAVTVPLWLRVLRWRLSVLTTASLIVLALGSFPVIQGIKLQQLSLLVHGLITVSVVFLAEGDFAAAGILLALATIKPQLTLPLVAWLLVWALSDWRPRQRFVWGFFGTLAALFGLGELVLPGWIPRFYQAVLAYRRYNHGAASALDLLFTPSVGRALTVGILIALVYAFWRQRRVSNRTPEFAWMIGLMLAATITIIPKEAPYNQVLLIAPILLVLRCLPPLWHKSGIFRISLAIAALIILWPWLAAFAITVSAVILPATALQRSWALPVYTSLTIPLAVFVMVAFVFKSLRWQPTDPKPDLH